MGYEKITSSSEEIDSQKKEVRKELAREHTHKLTQETQTALTETQTLVLTTEEQAIFESFNYLFQQNPLDTKLIMEYAQISDQHKQIFFKARNCHTTKIGDTVIT
jgi:hypothetical protein